MSVIAYLVFLPAIVATGAHERIKQARRRFKRGPRRF